MQFVSPKTLSLILLSAVSVAVVFAKPVRIGTEYNTRSKSSSILRQDIQSLQRDLREIVRKLEDIYLLDPHVLKEEKLTETSRLWQRAPLITVELESRLEDLQKLIGETHFVELSKRQKNLTVLQIQRLARRVAKMSPLDLYARSSQLRVGKLLAARSFVSQASQKPVSGAEIFKEMQRGYRAFFLRTTTTYKQAPAIFRKVTLEFKEYLPAALWLARTVYEMGEFEESAKILLGLLEVDPDLRIARSLDTELVEADELYHYTVPRLNEELPRDLPVLPHAVSGGGIESVPYAVVFSQDSNRIRGMEHALVVMDFAGSDAGFMALYGSIESGLKRERLGALGGLRRGMLEYLIASRALIFHAGMSPQADALRWHADYLTIEENDASMAFIREGNHPRQQLFVQPVKWEEVGYRLRRKPVDPLTLFAVRETGYPYQENSVMSVHLDLPNADVLSFELSPGTQGWQRRFNGKKTLNEEGMPVFTAPNLILQHVVEPGADSSVIGQGRFTAYLRGVRRTGFWQKDSEFLPTVYLEDDGKPLLLEPGSLWLVFFSSTGQIREDQDNALEN